MFLIFFASISSPVVAESSPGDLALKNPATRVSETVAISFAGLTNPITKFPVPEGSVAFNVCGTVYEPYVKL